MRDIGPQPSRFYLARHWQTRMRHMAVSGIWDNGSGRPPGIGRNLIADVSDDVRCDGEVRDAGTSYCRAATVPGTTAGQRQHHVGHGAAEMARSARPL